MDVHTTSDFAQFDAAAASFLQEDPVRSTVLLTILDMLRAGGGYNDAPPWFAWASVDDRTVGAALRTPPYKVALAGMEQPVAQALGAALASYDLPGGFGDVPTVAAFADAAGRRHAVRIHEIQYVQEAVVPPPPVRGTARQHRQHGYAATITAHVCQAAFAAGVRACTLFADATNATANGIYERIGFRPVAETVEADFV